MRTRLIVSAAVMFVAASAFGAGLDAKAVPAEAKWVGHLDVAALLNSGLGKLLLDKLAAPEIAEKIEGFVAKVGMDPRKDLTDVTFWGTSYERDAGVAVLRGTFDQAKLLALAQKNEKYKAIEHNGATIHSWVQKPDTPKDSGLRFGFFADASTLVIAGSEAGAKLAMDVLAGKVPALAANSPLLPALKEGTFLSVAGIDLAGAPQAAKNPQWAQLLSSGCAQLGQSGENVFLDITIVAADEKAANGMRQMVSGLLAMAQMAAEKGAEKGRGGAWLDLLNAFTVGGQGTTVTVGAEIEQAKLTEMLAQAKKMHHARKATTQP